MPDHPIPENGVVMHAGQDGELWSKPWADEQPNHPVLVLPCDERGETEHVRLLREAYEALPPLRQHDELLARIDAILGTTIDKEGT